ncbi:Glyoxal oxidase [Macleaya cordata]|uniref:Glyoxal oxidase n=1 Tax=Macleaya cordata TaxID=56857 RepID=A0A200R4J5_MACCD|nr:Glyoxal oxidase [Macleaya cordata]
MEVNIKPLLFPLIFKYSIMITTALFFTLQLVGFTTAIGRGSLSSSSSSGAKMGQWKILLKSTGVVGMHMALTHHNTVLMFDQTESGRSGYLLHGRKRGRKYGGIRCSYSDVNDSSCWAHSVEYDIAANSIRPLRLETDTWCSSGAFLSNGTLLQTGGHGNGYRRIRYFRPCSNHRCSWTQSRHSLVNNRWYSSNQRLPSAKDRVIVVGGKDTFSYEFVPKLSHSDERSFALPFLHKTYNRREDGNNLYPFLHLSSDGKLFIFANRDSILLDYKRDKVIKTYPRMPGGGSRNYPSSGSSVMLPLDHKDGFQKVEVMVCGGSSSGAYEAAQQGTHLKGLSTCGRMVITGHNHKWVMEHMPGPRLLNDMLILPTGQILIINGAKHGCAGWNNAANPSLQPYLYNPKKRWGHRFSVLKSAKIARLYHSSAILLPDGRVLVAGGNPNRHYTFKNVAFPTELRLQAFTPYYMERHYHNIRPSNVSINHKHSRRDRLDSTIGYGKEFTVRFRLRRKPSKVVNFNVYAPPFTTHSISMNQRMLKLRCRRMVREKDGWINAVIEAPPSANVAPSGYYMLTVVNEGIPSLSHWVRFDHV